MEIPFSTKQKHSCFVVDRNYTIYRSDKYWVLFSNQAYKQTIKIPARDDLTVEENRIVQGEEVILEYITGTFHKGNITIQGLKPSLNIIAKDAVMVQEF